MSAIARGLVGLAAVAVAAATFVYLNTAAADAMKPLADTCLAVSDFAHLPANMHSFHVTGVYPADVFLCIITPFFRAVKAGDQAVGLVTSFVLQAFVAFVAIGSVESTRTSSRWFVGWVGVVFLLSQLLGVSVAVPLLWLTSWVTQSSQPAALNPAMVHIATVGAIAVSAVLLGVPYIPENLFDRFMVVFNFGVVIPPLIWTVLGYIVGFSAHNQRSGAQAASHAYTFFAGICTLQWIQTLLSFYFVGGFPIERLWQIITAPAVADQVCFFLLIDGISLMVTLLLWAVYESDPLSVIKILLLTPLYGPGAAVLFFAAEREAHAAVKTKTA